MKRSIAFIILAMTCIVTNAQEMTDSLYRAQYKFALSQISPIASQIAGYREELKMYGMKPYMKIHIRVNHAMILIKRSTHIWQNAMSLSFTLYIW